MRALQKRVATMASGGFGLADGACALNSGICDRYSIDHPRTLPRKFALRVGEVSPLHCLVSLRQDTCRSGSTLQN